MSRVSKAITKKREAAPGPALRVRVRRQDGPDRAETSRYEEFEVELTRSMTVADVLAGIERRPVSLAGIEVAPIVWDRGCLAHCCGSCAMLINGRARLACATSVEAVTSRRRLLILEPLTKFPVLRDLLVDRSRHRLARARAEPWIEVDRGRDQEPMPLIAPDLHDERALLDRCLDCGLCAEACPQYGGDSEYLGPSAISRAHFANLHPLGALGASRRLELLMSAGGITDCGHANNCVEVCPARVPLVDSLLRVARATSARFIRHWLLG